MGKKLGHGGLESAAERRSERGPQDEEGGKKQGIGKRGQKTRQRLKLRREGKACQTHDVHANTVEESHPLALRQNYRGRRHERLDRLNAEFARGAVQHGRLAVSSE